MSHHRGHHRPRPERPTATGACPDCGHVAAEPARTTAGRLWRRLHPVDECFHAVYEYSVLRDGWCGCRSQAHRR